MIFVPRLLFFVLGSNFAKDKSNLLFGTVFFALVFFCAGVKFWESMGLQAEGSAADAS